MKPNRQTRLVVGEKQMNITRNATISSKGKIANINQQAIIQEGKMKITSSKLIRWSGLAAMGSGILYIAIQPIHPIDVLSSVTTGNWAIAHYMGVAMGILGLFGVAGIYARQVEKAGWLGLAGYLLLSVFYALTVAFQFIEAFISPLLATEAPKFVEGFLGIITGVPSQVNLGALPLINNLTGFAGYLLGGLLFGIATLRAGILPRWAGGLLAIGTVTTLARVVIPHPLDRVMAVPVGLALIWLGFALWSERREQVSQSSPVKGSSQLSQTGAD